MFEYRVVRYHNKESTEFTVELVEFDKQNNPIKIMANTNIVTSKNLADLNSLLVHYVSALTKPVVDSKLFVDDEDSFKKAQELMKNV